MERTVVDVFRVMWGDLHRQTALTCGEGTYHDHFLVARDKLGLDFLSVTDNAILAEDPRLRQFAGSHLKRHPHFAQAHEAHSISREEWDRLRKVVRSMRNERLILLLGYEWCSNRYGDRNVYYLHDGPLALPAELRDLHCAAYESAGLMVVHHPGYARGRRGVDWNHHNGHVERLVEIFSTQHGSSEGFAEDPEYRLYSGSMGNLCPESSVQEALSRRYKLGFTAGSDAHKLAQEPGRTGVYGKERSREGLWEGLQQRRTVATTGPHFGFWFEADGHGIGSIVTTDSLPIFRIWLPAVGWEQAELIRNGLLIKSWLQESVVTTRNLMKHRDGNLNLSYVERSSQALRPDNYYYVRLRLAEGHKAWSSPIWVSLLPDISFAHDVLYWLPEERCFFWGRSDNATAIVTVENHYAAHAAAGGLSTPADVTLQDVAVEVVLDDGRVTQKVALGSLQEGDSLSLELERPSPPHRFRLAYTDPFGNTRRIERRKLLANRIVPSFLRR